MMGSEGSDEYTNGMALQQTDPHELTNIYTTDPTSIFPSSSPSSNKIPIPSLLSRLDALLVVLKTCKARQCTHPWESLHPEGGVQTLKEALDPRFDAFYKSQGRVVWERCEEAYVREREGVEFEGGEDGGYMWHEVAVELE